MPGKPEGRIILDGRDRIRLAGEGEHGVNGGPPGDLYITVRAEPHPFFRREGDDIEIHVLTNEARRQAVLVAKFDNLGKGASGAAVQNLMLMLGR